MKIGVLALQGAFAEYKKYMNHTSYSSKIILIGDAEQLPSVAAGNVLFELLKSKAVPVVRL